MTFPHTEGGMRPDIATPDEVLETFTQLMRGEKSSEQLKAAEQLAKYHSLFVQKEDAHPPKADLAQEIDEAIRRLTGCQEVDSDGSGRP